MSVNGVLSTTVATQLSIVSNSKDLRTTMQLARNTESIEVMESIMEKAIDSKQPRLLMALAQNQHLPQEIEQRLAELSEQYPGVAKTLLDRRVSNE